MNRSAPIDFSPKVVTRWPESSSRRGLTILELVIVLAGVTLLSAIALPALARAREAARRVQCTSNLRQIGLALINYHDTHRMLPPGWFESGTVSSGWGWAAWILPELGQQRLSEQVRYDLPLGAEENRTLRTESLSVLRCPTDHVPVTFSLERERHSESEYQASAAEVDSVSEPLFDLAGASYVGVFGTEDPDTTEGTTGTGMFLADRSIRFSEVRDGLSQTLLVGERTARQLPATWVGVPPEGEEGPGRVTGFVDLPPNHPRADECEFSSRHPHGTQFIAADGHHLFISDAIDRNVFRELATRSEKP